MACARKECLDIARGLCAGTLQVRHVGFKQGFEATQRGGLACGFEVGKPGLGACDLGIDSLPHQFEQRARAMPSLLERQRRVLADLDLAAKVGLAVAERPDPTELAPRFGARYDQPPVADRQRAISSALAGLEVSNGDVGQRPRVGPASREFFGVETGRHTGRHRGLAAAGFS